ncbi:hypothetical protein SUGI_0894100 [Cryptomeria japonica]|uniref:disease resistance RPP13-like protein 4 n=1 Tax=Cryptomeria japonica TaxID=3369 RepID=UPI002414784D|nr:disease resistance RPP13-like protein 4 [Cryptomeria japonica]GLJ43077.1 hypothetical protein SUGI_0894100 [Cryptomeria japonica]
MGTLRNDVKDLMKKRAAEMIHDSLKGRKSLIVLDDVWRAAKEDKIIEKLGLPIGNDGQYKVVVTTRNKEVGQNLKARIYEMELLSMQESWQLFCAYALPDYDKNLPPYHLEEIALQVEKRCARLPLALKTTGASLSGCTDIRK